MAERKGSAAEQSHAEGSRSVGGVRMLRVPGGRMVQVHVFPDDARLAADVTRLAESIGNETSFDRARWRARVEERLRGWYPKLVIHTRTDIATIMPSEEVWYVMRDGRVRRTDERRDRLHAALAAARDVTTDADAALTRSRNIAAAAGSSRRARGGAGTATLEAPTGVLGSAAGHADDDEATGAGG